MPLSAFVGSCVAGDTALSGLSVLLSWKVVGSLLTVFAASGYLADSFVLNRRDKDAIHSSLIGLWNRLDDIRVRDYHRRLASATLRALRVKTTQDVILAVASTVLLSWSFTTFAYEIAGWPPNRVEQWHDHFPFIDIYAVKLVFDVLTIVVALTALRQLRRRGFLAALGITTLAIGISCLLAVASVTSMLVFNDLLDRRLQRALEPLGFAARSNCFKSVQSVNWPRNLWIAPGTAVQVERRPVSFRMLFTETALAYWSVVSRQEIHFEGPVMHVDAQGNPWSIKGPIVVPKFEMLYGVTSLVPVGALLVALLFLALVKVMSLVAKMVAMRFLERFTEIDPGRARSFLPGTRFGVLFGLLAVIVKAIADLYG